MTELQELRKTVCDANLELVRRGLVVCTFGNVSGIDRSSGLVAIKPSGVDYACMTPDDMVLVSLADGEVVEGSLRPSSDTPTHLEIYRAFQSIGGVVHIHSSAATAWAQACRDIPALGTTHADYFYGPVPCTRQLRNSETSSDYEQNTGRVIVETLKGRSIDEAPGVLVASHGPFCWGREAMDAVHNAVILEYIAELAVRTLTIRPDAPVSPQDLLDRHFLRKHGVDRYYGQK